MTDLLYRSRAAKAAAVLVMLILSVVAAVGIHGPLKAKVLGDPVFQTPPASGIAGWTPVGERVTFGTPVLKPVGEGTITLLSVRPVNLSGPLEYLGSVVADPDRPSAGVATGSGFPTTDFDLGPIQNSEGAELVIDERAKERGWEILVGYRVTGPGVGTHDALEIDYEVNGRRYSFRYPGSVTVCSGEFRGEHCKAHSPDS